MCRTAGVLSGQKTDVPQIIRINLIIVSLLTGMKRLICGHQFILVATLAPERDVSGKVREFSPRAPDGRELSDAPFCRFGFPTDHQGSGVYAVALNDHVVYVGQTNSLSRRFGLGEYGEIAVPESGSSQVTNRRVNHGILEATRRGDVVQVWFHEISNRDSVENALIERLDLLWNRQGQKTTSRAIDTSQSPGLADWSSVMRAAEMAKAALRADRTRGEELFAKLMAAHPNDGMVYLKRAEAYERFGDRAAAAPDFARAEELLPFPGRKAEARAGLHRTRSVC